MGKKEEQAVEVQETEGTQEQQVEVIAELTISVNSDGSIGVNIPEGGRELSPLEVEGVTRSVYEQLRDTRIAQAAVEMFKSKLG